MSKKAAEIHVIYIYFYFLVGFYCREYCWVMGLINSCLTSRQYVGLFFVFIAKMTKAWSLIYEYVKYVTYIFM